MTNKIDDLNARFLIPGAEVGALGSVDPESVEEDIFDAPYSTLPKFGEGSLPRDWQDLFGLNQVSPEPTHMDPPPRPPSLRGESSTGNVSEPSIRLMQGSFSRSGNGVPPSGNVRRMITMMTSYAHAIRGIRARSLEGGGR